MAALTVLAGACADPGRGHTPGAGALASDAGPEAAVTGNDDGGDAVADGLVVSTTAADGRSDTVARDGGDDIGGDSGGYPLNDAGRNQGNKVTSDHTIIDETAPLPLSAEELAAELTERERALRSGELTREQLAQVGRRQQALYRRLGVRPEWADTVLDEVAGDVADAVALNWEARQNLQALLATHVLHDTMPAWRIVPPPPAEELLTYYKEAQSETGIEWEYLAAINLVETRMGRIQGISTAGAVGPMQFLPTTWAECCQGDPTVPRDAIIGAATYLTHRGGPANMSKAIWGYNNSGHYVDAVTAYARVMMEDERAYHGYHAWGVYFLTTEGVIAIDEGYEPDAEIPVTEWLARNPETLVSG